MFLGVTSGSVSVLGCFVRQWIHEHASETDVALDSGSHVCVCSPQGEQENCIALGDDFRYCFRTAQMLGSTVDSTLRQCTGAVWTNFHFFLREVGLRIRRCLDSLPDDIINISLELDSGFTFTRQFVELDVTHFLCDDVFPCSQQRVVRRLTMASLPLVTTWEVVRTAGRSFRSAASGREVWGPVALVGLQRSRHLARRVRPLQQLSILEGDEQLGYILVYLDILDLPAPEHAVYRMKNEKDSAFSVGVNQYNLSLAVVHDHEVSGSESGTDYWKATFGWECHL